MDVTATLAAIDSALANLAAHGTDGAAEKLKAEGIRGKRECADACILAKYIAAVVDLPAGTMVRVYPSCTRDGLAAAGVVSLRRARLGETALPVELSALAFRFDRGDYPELVQGALLI